PPGPRAGGIPWPLDPPRRSMWLGPSALAAIVASAIAPNLVDRYLALTGYRAQQTPKMRESTRPDNLYGPVEGDVGAHGPFDHRSHERSIQPWLAKHRTGLSAAAAAAAGGVAVGARANK